MKINAPNCGIQMSGAGSTGKYMRITADGKVLTGNYAALLFSVDDSGVATATSSIV